MKMKRFLLIASILSFLFITQHASAWFPHGGGGGGGGGSTLIDANSNALIDANSNTVIDANGN